MDSKDVGRYYLLRIDDNGNTAMVPNSERSTQEEAETLRVQYEKNGHKQHYYIAKLKHPYPDS